VHLFHFLLELFSFGFDVLCTCKSSIEMNAQVLHFIFLGSLNIPRIGKKQELIRYEV
jgi:hypothetical protein